MPGPDPPPPPKGNDRAVGNDGGAPEGNTNAAGHGPPANNQNAATHQLNADPAKALAWLEQTDPESYAWVQGKYSDYLTDAPFGPGTAKADQLEQIAVCEFIIWRNRGVQLKDGVVTKTHMKDSDGTLHEVEAERPNNQAVNRMDRNVMSKLKDLGILDDPDSRMAGAMESMASDDYVIEVESEDTTDAATDDTTDEAEAEANSEDTDETPTDEATDGNE